MATAGKLNLRVSVETRPATTALGRINFTVRHLGHKGRDVRCWTARRLWGVAHQVGRLADRIDPVDRHKK